MVTRGRGSLGSFQRLPSRRFCRVRPWTDCFGAVGGVWLGGVSDSRRGILHREVVIQDTVSCTVRSLRTCMVRRRAPGVQDDLQTQPTPALMAVEVLEYYIQDHQFLDLESSNNLHI